MQQYCYLFLNYKVQSVDLKAVSLVNIGTNYMSKINRTNKSTLPRSAARGFTLIEILVVVTIIALLAGMIGWKVFGVLGASKQHIAKTQASTLAKALDQYRLETGVVIEDGMDLIVLTFGPDEGGGPNSPYLTKRGDEGLKDPWGFYFMVRVPGEINVEFDIFSYGSDNKQGGTGENADVTN